MRFPRGAIAIAVVAAGCGPTNQSSGIVGPSGGDVCLVDSRVCIVVPMGGLDRNVTLKITPTTSNLPAGAIGDAVDIGPSGTKFLKPATVIFKINDVYDVDGGVDPSLMRLFTRYEGDWEPLGTPVPTLDRVKRTLSGTVEHLSPFVILRADRLPDGGLPYEIDSGVKDAGVIIIPYFDAGRPDAGPPDAGKPDAGPPDAGKPDGGPPDAGPPDAGIPDAGKPDAGPPDAGPPDAGPPDAGSPDAGPPDAGPPDAGLPDAGPPDAGPADAGFDAGEVDAGDGG